MSSSTIHIEGQRPPIVVHRPRQMRKALKAFLKHGPTARYDSVCRQSVHLPEGVVIRENRADRVNDRIYLVCGPNDRYYEGCRACGYLPDA